MINYADETGGFTIRLEQHAGRTLVRVRPYGIWGRTVSQAFRAASLRTCAELSGRRWSMLWENGAFPRQRPYVLAVLEHARRAAILAGMETAAVLEADPNCRVTAGLNPRFTSEREAIAYAVGLH